MRKVDGLEIENAREYNFQIHQESRAQIVFRNISENDREIKFHSIDSLVDIPSLTIIHDGPKSIKSGNDWNFDSVEMVNYHFASTFVLLPGETFNVTLKACFNVYDAKKYPMVVEISLETGSQFIDLLLEPVNKIVLM